MAALQLGRRLTDIDISSEFACFAAERPARADADGQLMSNRQSPEALDMQAELVRLRADVAAVHLESANVLAGDPCVRGHASRG